MGHLSRPSPVATPCTVLFFFLTVWRQNLSILIGPPPTSKVAQANGQGGGGGGGEGTPLYSARDEVLELILMNNHTTPKSWATFDIFVPSRPSSA